MSRAWRIQYEDAVYHVASRGNNRHEIFMDDNDRGHFLELLGRARIRFGLRIFAFCLMSNHFHLLLQTPLSNLSAAMHWLNGSYTGYFNRRHNRIGHLFHGRYKSVLVLRESHWLHLSMYIHLNPVRAKIVDDPGRYFWSSCYDYTHARPRYDWLERDMILSDYGTDQKSCLRNYRRECLAMSDKKPEFLEQLRGGTILGAKEELEKLVKKYYPSGRHKDVPEYSAAARREADPAREIERVALIFKVRPEQIKGENKKSPARRAAFYHLVENCGVSVKDTAKIMGVGKAGVSMAIQRLKKDIQNNSELKKSIDKLKHN